MMLSRGADSTEVVRITGGYSVCILSKWGTHGERTHSKENRGAQEETKDRQQIDFVGKAKKRQVKTSPSGGEASPGLLAEKGSKKRSDLGGAGQST